jgi:hypothetical protein
MLAVTNADPAVSITVAPTLPALPGALLDVAASVDDAGANDTVVCTIDWGDGTASSGLAATPTCSASHSYPTKGAKHVVVTATDDDGGTDSVDLTITVLDRAPTATGASITTLEDTATPITLTGADPDGDALAFLVTGNPAHGSLAGTGANRVYTPDADYHGADSFTFTVTDGSSTSPPATIAITVTSVNDAPVAAAIPSLSALSGSATPVTLSGIDVDGDSLTVVLIAAPAHGSLTGTGSAYTYTSLAGYAGPDSFVYAMSDGLAQSAPVTVAVDVAPAPGSPRLMLSDDANRSTNTRSLGGADITAGAAMFVFLDPQAVTAIRRVTFVLDGVPFASDASAPYDLNGTSTGRPPCRNCARPANPFESNLLTMGAHTITADILRRDGSRVAASATFVVSATTTHSLLVSGSPRREAAVALQGAVLSGQRYIFLGGLGDPIAGLSSITFRLDGRRVGTETTEPYDMLGSRRGGAIALTTRFLRNGEHRVTATIRLAGGGVITYEARFTVAN